MNPAPRTQHVLIAEDDPGDAELTREAFGQHQTDRRLHFVSDGEQALQFLRRIDAFADMPRPDLIVLDINMPRLTGLEVLAQVKADASLHTIPVVIFTTSRDHADISRSYGSHANAYVTKPRELDEFDAAVQTIDDFYLRVVTPCP